MLLAIGNGAFLYSKYRAGFQATFGGEAVREHPLFQAKVEKIVALVQDKAKTVPEASFAGGATDSTAKVFDDYFENLKTPDIFRIKVWDKNYTVIWSNTSELIGRSFPDNHETQEALEGEIEVEVAKGKPEHYTERSFSNYAEIYVPIKGKSGNIVGVVETYIVTDEVISQLRSEFYKSAVMSVGASLVVFVIAAIVLRFAVKK